jgi:hypothetical protein
MIEEINLWFIRNFLKINIKKAIELGFTFDSNVHGDFINRANCRSFWTDEKGRFYKVSEEVNKIPYTIKSRIDYQYRHNAWIEKGSVFFHIRTWDGSVRLCPYDIYELVD